MILNDYPRFPLVPKWSTSSMRCRFIVFGVFSAYLSFFLLQTSEETASSIPINKKIYNYIFTDIEYKIE